MKHVSQLSQHIYYLPPDSSTDRPVLGVINGKHYSLYIDGGNSANHAQTFRAQLEVYQLSTPLAVFLTHWHWDHSFGLHDLQLVTISHEDTKTALQSLLPYKWDDASLNERVKSGIEIEFCATYIREEYGSNRDITIKIPEITFTTSMVIDLGDVTVEIEYLGGDHSADSSIAYIPEDKVLFLGDALYANMYNGPYHYTVKEITRLLEKIDTFDAEIYVLSHQMPQSKEEFSQFAKMLKILCELTTTYQGNKAEITKAVEHHNEIKLDDLALECIEYFTNPYEQDDD